MLKKVILSISLLLLIIVLCSSESCIAPAAEHNSYVNQLSDLATKIVPPLQDEASKGDAGKIGVIGGSTEYTGAPYFSAISALKVGADLVYVITTDQAAPIIKAYSPDLIVYPILHDKHASKINMLLSKLDLVIIGPGLGREDDNVQLILNILKTCKELSKPLVVDADGLYAIYKKISVIQGYPSPGVILTPNKKEAGKLMKAVTTATNDSNWYDYWGENVSVLLKGKDDQFVSASKSYSWSSSEEGSGRRVGGQGDILSGSLGTLYNWAIKSNICDRPDKMQIAQSVASYAAAKLTRLTNRYAFMKFGRSLTASDMLNEIHVSIKQIFGQK